jgi:hypothetical protein
MMLRKLSAIGAVSACFGLALPSIGQEVLPGYDLFDTQAGTTFQGAPFVGVPVGSYNFGGSIGTQSVGNTDTIVQRLAPATPGSPTIPIVMDALQLESATPISLGGGPLGFYFVTLQSTDGAGPASTGSMTINFSNPGSGTFTSFFDVFADIHFGAPNGPIVAQPVLTLQNPGASWGNVAPPGATLINGVDNMLNGANTANDFWPMGSFTESEPGATHVVAPDVVPEPSTFVGLLMGAGAFLARRRTVAAV